MRKTLFAFGAFILSASLLAESFEARSLRMLINDPKFAEYVSKNETSERVTFKGVRLSERVKPGERLYWYVDFEGGTRPEFAKVICLGHATTGEADVAFDMDMPVDCKVIRFQE